MCHCCIIYHIFVWGRGACPTWWVLFFGVPSKATTWGPVAKKEKKYTVPDVSCPGVQGSPESWDFKRDLKVRTSRNRFGCAFCGFHLFFPLLVLFFYSFSTLLTFYRGGTTKATSKPFSREHSTSLDRQPKYPCHWSSSSRLSLSLAPAFFRRLTLDAHPAPAS